MRDDRQHTCESMPGLSSGIGWTLSQRRVMFRELVCAEMRRGIMTRRRWRSLVRFAAMLNLPATDAGELIEQARERTGNDGMRTELRRLRPDVPVERPIWPTWSKLSMAGAILAVADALLFHIVF